MGASPKELQRGGRWAPALLPLLVLLAAGCSQAQAPCPGLGSAPEIPAGELAVSLFLIGDTGEPRPGGEPVLEALGRQLAERARLLEGEAWAVFLGDNVYQRGLPAPEEPGHAQARARLDAQLALFTSGAGEAAPRGIFLPGNHDWDHGGARGLARVRRQEAYIAEHGGGRARMLPGRGCPGPAVVDLGRRLRLVAVDTQWWLHRHRRPRGPSSPCPATTGEEALGQLARALEGAAGRRTVVAAHHPLVSGGPHGTRRGLRTWLGFSVQDLVARPYREMRAALARALAPHPPLFYASGHDHSLQILAAEGLPLQVVSGAGCAARLTSVRTLPSTLFCHGGPGFLRLDVARDGRARLAALALQPGAGGLTELGALALPGGG